MTRTGNISAGTLPVDAATLTHQAFGGALTIPSSGASLLVVAQMVSHCYPLRITSAAAGSILVLQESRLVEPIGASHASCLACGDDHRRCQAGLPCTYCQCRCTYSEVAVKMFSINCNAALTDGVALTNSLKTVR